MAKTVYYSRKFEMETAAKPEAAAPVKVAAAKPAAKAKKAGPLLLAVCLAVAVMSVLLVPLLMGSTATAASRGSAAAAPQVQVVNTARQAYETPQLAMQAAGLEVALPEALPEGVSMGGAYVVDGAMLEIELYAGRTLVLYRAAAGNEDLSGVAADAYTFTLNEEVDGITRGYAGASEKKLHTAIWTNGGNSYALVADAGIEAALMKELAQSIA